MSEWQRGINLINYEKINTIGKVSFDLPWWCHVRAEIQPVSFILGIIKRPNGAKTVFWRSEHVTHARYDVFHMRRLHFVMTINRVIIVSSQLVVTWHLIVNKCMELVEKSIFKKVRTWKQYFMNCWPLNKNIWSLSLALLNI